MIAMTWHPEGNVSQLVSERVSQSVRDRVTYGDATHLMVHNFLSVSGCFSEFLTIYCQYTLLSSYVRRERSGSER